MKKHTKYIGVMAVALVLLGGGCVSPKPKPVPLPPERPAEESGAAVSAMVPDKEQLVEDNLDASLEAVAALQELGLE